MINKKKILLMIIGSVLLSLLLSNTSLAYSIDPSYRPVNSPFDLDYKSETPTSNTVLILQILSGALLYFASPLAIFFIALAGFKMVTGGAESESLEEGKKGLTWSVIGLLVIILSYSIVRFVINLIITSGSAVNVS